MLNNDKKTRRRLKLKIPLRAVRIAGPSETIFFGGCRGIRGSKGGMRQRDLLLSTQLTLTRDL
jgi:hypothetical protein